MSEYMIDILEKAYAPGEILDRLGKTRVGQTYREVFGELPGIWPQTGDGYLVLCILALTQEVRELRARDRLHDTEPLTTPST